MGVRVRVRATVTVTVTVRVTVRARVRVRRSATCAHWRSNEAGGAAACMPPKPRPTPRLWCE